ncbi:exopolysaccharide biosynthesis protein [Asticcacaulis machinosus]|uniref:Exopolysaccharide biosynthesis protein n=1 Tax=Asticcacaulis machinosus TaxID=2984211 RepID=A0ABT5HF92_9CAUL|nr:exopolysaccharide biosynthesis protein [Asticcacaulis machinosus]MDC7674741.1 exopolysaccharide biosynthesis protein [Asticcacaulis machinosus]
MAQILYVAMHHQYGDAAVSEFAGFKDTSVKVSDMLSQTITMIDGKSVTLRELISRIGEQGFLLLCALLTLPFLLPVSIPGVSTVFGVAILLISLAITLNRLPWLPSKILDRELETLKLVPVLEKGVKIVSKIDRFVQPRLLVFSTGAIMNRINGLVLMFSALLLMLPLGFIPFSNTLPGVAILLMSIGMVQRDGVLVVVGYGFVLATLTYFSILAYAAYSAGQGFSSLLG